MTRGARLEVFVPLCWWRHQKSWRLGTTAVAGLSLVVAVSAILCVIAACPLLPLRHYKDSLLSTPHAVWLLVDAVTAAAAYGYIYMGCRAERSPQLHAHGFILCVMHLSIVCGVAQAALELAEVCVWHVVSLCLTYTAWGIYKITMFLLIGEKMVALGPPTDCWLDAGAWARAAALSAAAATVAGVGLCTWAAAVVLEGLSCEEFYEMVKSGADVTLIGILACVASISACLLLVAGSGMMRAAVRLRQRAISKVAERQVPNEVLTTVKRLVGQHVLGVLTCTITAQLVVVVAVLEYLHLLGRDGSGPAVLIPIIVRAADYVGDVIAILMLSGIGDLLFRDSSEAEAGDISGHIRGLLHSAVLEGQAEMVFEGSVASTPTNLCVASFPGKYMADWQSLTWSCEQGEISSACVFLPKADDEGRFGTHAARSEHGGKCWCHSIYGEQKPWGCAWFPAWQSNIHRAVELQLELLVVFFPGQVGQGVVRWADLGKSSLWDGVGLGGSQKCEVAYLERCGLPVTQLDLEAFRHRVRRAGLGSFSRPSQGRDSRYQARLSFHHHATLSMASHELRRDFVSKLEHDLASEGLIVPNTWEAILQVAVARK